MAHLQSKHIFQGMSRDLSDSNQKATFYIDAHNIRITAREGNTLLSVTNEKGNKLISLTPEDFKMYVAKYEQYIGHGVLNNYLILFTKSTKSLNEDHIWRIDLSRQTSKLLYSGLLNFNKEYPIETLVDFETEDTQKVYWVDGINSPRMMNIMLDYTYNTIGEIDTQFDFSPDLTFQETVNITRESLNGQFLPGTIQYLITYITKTGIETKPFYVSPLYYTSHYDRGAKSEEVIANSFKIVVNNVDTKYKYINIYSVQRTAVNADAIGKLVASLNIDNIDPSEISYIDNGTSGFTTEPSSLFYIGSEKIIAYAIAEKDSTLFLGNITLQGASFDEDIKQLCRKQNVIWQTRTDSSISFKNIEGNYYQYDNQLNKNSNQIKTFKFRETYRLGLQFQESNGNWTEPYFIVDSENNQPIIYQDTDAFYPNAVCTLNSDIINKALSLGFKRVRPLIAVSNITDRTILCQGVVCPTVYNMSDRKNNAPFVQSSWFFRPEIISKQGMGYYKFNKISPTNAKFQEQLKNVSTKTRLTCYINGLTYTFGVRYAPISDRNDYAYMANGTFYMILYLISIIDPSHNEEFYNGDYSPFIDSNTFNNVDFFNTENNQILSGWKFIEYFSNINESFDLINNQQNGVYYESRHNYPIPDNLQVNAEIQCNEKFRSEKFGDSDTYSPLECFTPRLVSEEFNELQNTVINNSLIEKNGDRFFIDKSIVTFHSPDIELNNSLNTIDTSAYKFRIIGAIPITGNYSTTSISTEDGPQTFHDTNIKASGSNVQDVHIKNKSITDFNPYGGCSKGSSADWIDAVYGNIGGDYIPTLVKASYVIYPWHKSGPLNNSGNRNPLSTSVLSKKTLAQLHFSNKTIYFSKGTIDIKSSNAELYDGGISLPMIRIKTINNSSLSNITYYGECDKLIVPYEPYYNVFSGATFGVSLFNDSRMDSGFNWDNLTSTSYSDQLITSTWFSRLFTNFFGTYKYSFHLKFNGDEAIHMSYKSSPHYVIAFDYKNEHKQQILPSFNQHTNAYNSSTHINRPNLNYYPFWLDVDKNTIYPFEYDQIKLYESQSSIYAELNDQLNSNAFLYLGELYNPNVENRFGGTSDFAIQNNSWIPAGDTVLLQQGETTIKWTEGDTYFQRYDCLKTYPYSSESKNNIVEILSFMCETRTNIDGRYDRNRGLLDNTNITNENFNLLNPAYSQDNNFYTYYSLGEKFKNNKFSNQITWSTTKSVGSIVDNWTHITLANTIDLGGNKGQVNSLKKYNNNIIAFQDRAITEIVYNPNVQINSSDGLPIEIANSGKVQGSRVISENIGCINKWSINNDMNSSIYFIDSLNKNICRLNNNGLISLSNDKGLSEWMNNINTIDIWSAYPTVSNGFRTFYDKIFKDVYFVNNNTCLVFSEILDQFISFMDYQQTNCMFNVLDNFYAIYNGNIYNQFKGEYNNIYDTYRDYWITFVDNQTPEKNKIYTNIEYYSDVYDSNDNNIPFETFDIIRIWNEYQDSGNVEMKKLLGIPQVSNLQKKFRVWRAQLPRDKSNKINRINNTWAKITLGKRASLSKYKNHKLELHNLLIGYNY